MPSRKGLNADGLDNVAGPNEDANEPFHVLALCHAHHPVHLRHQPSSARAHFQLGREQEHLGVAMGDAVDV